MKVCEITDVSEQNDFNAQAYTNPMSFLATLRFKSAIVITRKRWQLSIRWSVEKPQTQASELYTLRTPIAVF